MKFHKEGIPSLILAIIFFILLYLTASIFAHEIPVLKYLLIGLGASVLLIILQFFRDPKRNFITHENEVICPADGEVVVIEETNESEYFKDNRIQVSIFMSPVNVHINRFPISGIVKYVKYHPGKYLVAWHPKSSTENERTSIVVEHANKQQLLFRQIAGALARRIVWYCKVGESANQTDQFGFIKFGSRVDVFLPVGSKINVQLNQKVKGGITSLATFS